MKTISSLLILASIGCLASARAEETNSLAARLRIDQNLGQEVSLDLPFRDDAGKQVKLGDYFGSRPVILILGYYRCQILCRLVADGLSRTLRTLPLEPGRDFEIVSISIDPEETPEMASEKKALYLKAYERPAATEHWHCLTGPKESVETVAKQVGFNYFLDKSTHRYAHASCLYILSPTGKITRYFFGDEFRALDMRLAIADSAQNKTGSVQEAILRFCYSYDPTTGRYGLAIINILRVAGVLTVLGLAGFIGLNLRRERLRAATSPGGG